MTTRDMTDEELTLLHYGATMESQLPLRFDNGFTLTKFSGKCAFCGVDFTEGQMKAQVTWLLPTVVAVRTMTHCNCCNSVTGTTHRVRSDGKNHQIEFFTDDGQWVVSKFKKAGVFNRILGWIGLR